MVYEKKKKRNSCAYYNAIKVLLLRILNAHRAWTRIVSFSVAGKVLNTFYCRLPTCRWLILFCIRCILFFFVFVGTHSRTVVVSRQLTAAVNK